MKQVRIGRVANHVELRSERHAIRKCRRHALRQEIDECGGLLDLRGWRLELAGMVDPHVANHAADMPPGKRVVADVGDSVRDKAIAANREDLFPDGRRHPRVDAVADDVIEHAERGVHVGDVMDEKLDIGQPEGLGHLPAPLDLTSGKVDADETCVGHRQRYRNEVIALGTAELHHVATLEHRRIHSEQPRKTGQPVRMTLRKCLVG